MEGKTKSSIKEKNFKRLQEAGGSKSTAPRNILTRTSKEIFDAKELNYLTLGDKTNPVLFLVHGLRSSHMTFMNIVDELKSDYYLIVLDQRGHGSSKEAAYDYSLDSMANDINSVLNYLGIKDPIYLLGHSYGGRTAMRFCELYPKAVKKLIIEDMEFCKRKACTVEEAKRNADKYRKEIPLIYSDEKEFLTQLSKTYGKIETQGFLERRSKVLEDGKIQLLFKPWVSEIYGNYSAAADFTEFIRSTKLPLLVIVAEKSSAISINGMKHMINLNKDIKVAKISGSNHNVHGSSKDLYMLELKKFLEN